jgi:hypothetical protein
VDRALAIADHAVLLAKGSVAWTGPSGEAEAAMERVLAAGQQVPLDPADPLAGTVPAPASSVGGSGGDLP